MAVVPVFLSIVLVVRDQASQLESLLTEAENHVASCVSEYELILIDNASEDGSVVELQRLSGQEGLANLQVYALAKQVDVDTAAWVGLENALGDLVVVLDPMADDIAFLPIMLENALSGADVVFVDNAQKAPQSFAYRMAAWVFSGLYIWLKDIHLAKEAPQYRLLSRRVINFIIQHSQPDVAYRYLPATSGFARVNLNYSAAPKSLSKKRLGESVERGIRLLVSTTHAPMRLVTTLSLFGALANVVYSVYVIIIGLVKSDVAPGWVSLSLQQSGMFFLISLVLLILGEYILHMASLSNEGPRYYVSQEFTSARMTRREKLNVEEVAVAEHNDGAHNSNPRV